MENHDSEITRVNNAGQVQEVIMSDLQKIQDGPCFQGSSMARRKDGEEVSNEVAI